MTSTCSLSRIVGRKYLVRMPGLDARKAATTWWGYSSRLRIKTAAVLHHERRTEFPPAMIALINSATARWLSISSSVPTAFSWVAAASRRTPTISCSDSNPRSFMASRSASQIDRAARPACSLAVDIRVSFLDIVNPRECEVQIHPYFSQEVLYAGLIQSSVRVDFRSWVATRQEPPWHQQNTAL